MVTRRVFVSLLLQVLLLFLLGFGHDGVMFLHFVLTPLPITITNFTICWCRRSLGIGGGGGNSGPSSPNMGLSQSAESPTYVRSPYVYGSTGVN